VLATFSRQHFPEVLVSSTIFSQHFYKMLQHFVEMLDKFFLEFQHFHKHYNIFRNVGFLNIFSSTFFNLLQYFLVEKNQHSILPWARPARDAAGATAGTHEPQRGRRAPRPAAALQPASSTRVAVRYRSGQGASHAGSVLPWRHPRRRVTEEKEGLATAVCAGAGRPARERRR
jgi:hypothetical protein